MLCICCFSTLQGGSRCSSWGFMSVDLWHGRNTCVKCVWSSPTTCSAPPASAQPSHWVPVPPLLSEPPTHRRGNWRFQRAAPPRRHHWLRQKCGLQGAQRPPRDWGNTRHMTPTCVRLHGSASGPRRWVGQGVPGRVAHLNRADSWQLAVRVAGADFPQVGSRQVGISVVAKKLGCEVRGGSSSPQPREWAVSRNEASACLPQLCWMFWKHSEGKQAAMLPGGPRTLTNQTALLRKPQLLGNWMHFGVCSGGRWCAFSQFIGVGALGD